MLSQTIRYKLGPSEAELSRAPSMSCVMTETLRFDESDKAESVEKISGTDALSIEDDKRFNLLCSYIFDDVGDAMSRVLYITEKTTGSCGRCFLASKFVTFSTAKFQK
jgi:hypothetical protein